MGGVRHYAYSAPQHSGEWRVEATLRGVPLPSRAASRFLVRPRPLRIGAMVPRVGPAAGGSLLALRLELPRAPALARDNFVWWLSLPPSAAAPLLCAFEDGAATPASRALCRTPRDDADVCCVTPPLGPQAQALALARARAAADPAAPQGVARRVWVRAGVQQLDAAAGAVFRHHAPLPAVRPSLRLSPALGSQSGGTLVVARSPALLASNTSACIFYLGDKANASTSGLRVRASPTDLGSGSGTSFAYSPSVHSSHARRDRVVSVATASFVWRSHTKSPTTRAGRALDLALRLE